MVEFDKIFRVVKLLKAEKERMLSKYEQAILQEWLNEDKANRSLYESLMNKEHIPEIYETYKSFNQEEAYLKFLKRKESKGRKIVINLLKVAAVLIPLAVVTFFLTKESNKPLTFEEVVDTTIHPGSSKAMLKLADGSVINLEKEEKEIDAVEGTLISNNKKEIVYSPKNKKAARRKAELNSIQIPRGGEYQLQLSDGTRIWLNSETKIVYPVLFNKKYRQVFLEGEAYFEVAENKDVPFIVNTVNTVINVTGTEFNVRSYFNEEITSTTLVKGGVVVKIADSDDEIKLVPNQQVTVTNNKAVVEEVDVNRFVAWKNGRIYFEENTLEEIFNELARWYDISINFADDDLKNLRFSIDVARYENCSRLFELLTLTKKVNFKIENNEVTVFNWN